MRVSGWWLLRWPISISVSGSHWAWLWHGALSMCMSLSVSAVFLGLEASFSFHFRDCTGLDLVRFLGSYYGPSRSLRPTSAPSPAGEGRSHQTSRDPYNRRFNRPRRLVREESQRALAESVVKCAGGAIRLLVNRWMGGCQARCLARLAMPSAE